MNILLTWILIIAAGLFLLFLWSIHPGFSNRRNTLAFAKWNYAHRGLWNLDEGIPENSLPAFQRAVNAGYGIELDVHLTMDGHVIVYHDDTLNRVCGRNGRIESMTLRELKDCRLSGTVFTMPLLTEVLEIVQGRVPLLIELKLPSRNVDPLCDSLMEILDTYDGHFMIESFNPFGLFWFRKHYPRIVRGQLSTVYDFSLKLPGYIKAASTSLVCNAVSRPDFIAFNYKHTDKIGLRLNKNLFKAPVFAWTVRSPEAYRKCSSWFDSIIFEKIAPAPKREGKAS